MWMLRVIFMVCGLMSSFSLVAQELAEIVGKPKGSPYRATEDYYLCMPEGTEPITDWLNWGELGVWCDPHQLDAYYQYVEPRVEYRYPGLIIPERQSEFAVRKPVLSKLVALSTVMIYAILKERGLQWSATESKYFQKRFWPRARVDSNG